MRGVVVAGTRSGCGKTSAALGLAAALSRRGLRVAPFKCGPDFIDPGFLEAASGRPCHNLDSWMCGPGGVREIFARHVQGADVAVIEGAMGLFDGFGLTEEGSAAHTAKLLGLPVLLAADASAMARSAAAMVRGYLDFDPELAFCGVLLNRVGSPRHGEILRQALAQSGIDLPVGILLRDEGLAAPSRHLGLVQAEEHLNPSRLGALAEWVESSLDLDSLLDTLPECDPAPSADPEPAPPRARIGLAWDPAFRFYYHENLRLLRAAGAELVPFSPVADRRPPENLDGLYLGGGYPELHGLRLSDNASMRRAVRGLAESGLPIYAECGGFMFLMDSLVMDTGQLCRMCGLFPYRATMNARFSALGYRAVETRQDSILGPAGTLARGHEFHYSSIPEETYRQATLFSTADRNGPREGPEGFTRHQTAASYIHLHFGSNPALAANFVTACAKGAD
ncbi:cobyrinate a,c-diamide synthase [Desulfohalovibrio reitneri]|uniref:cobyrinate a,c-diamide synthase n=1 Tax=Desulfohalovibrio reitneri TaxID=1307759 RepID=UPI0004A6F2E3|nr:cobyrinate a,c-diamide synthase [Desulfohalovibrio reitneri]